MPGHDGRTLLCYEFQPGRKLWVGLHDGDLGAAIDHLIGVIRVSSEDRNDPTAGTWYCEVLDR